MKKKYAKGDTINGFFFIEEIAKNKRPQKRKRRGVFKCHCGNLFESNLDNIKTIKSCGCYRKEQDKQKSLSTLNNPRLSWLYKDLTEKIEYNMTTPVDRKKYGFLLGQYLLENNQQLFRHNKYLNRNLPDICEEWFCNKKSFIDWSLNNGYDDLKELVRIDKNKAYSPENCEWKLFTQNYKPNQLHVLLSDILKKEKMNVSHHYSYRYSTYEYQIDEEWLKDERTFFKWALSNGFTTDMTLERKDNFKDLNQDNCIWKPISERVKNLDRLEKIIRFEKKAIKETFQKGLWRNYTNGKIDSTWEKNHYAFCEWSLSNGYTSKKKLVRIDEKGDISPENCKWICFEGKDPYIKDIKTNKLTYEKVNEIRKSPHSPKEISHRSGFNISTINDVLHFHTWTGKTVEYEDINDIDENMKKIMEEFFDILDTEKEVFFCLYTKKGELVKLYVNERCDLIGMEGGWRHIDEFSSSSNGIRYDLISYYEETILKNQPELCKDEFIWQLCSNYPEDNEIRMRKMCVDQNLRSSSFLDLESSSYTISEFQKMLDKDPEILNGYVWVNNFGIMRKQYTDPNDWSKTIYKVNDEVYSEEKFYRLKIR